MPEELNTWVLRRSPPADGRFVSAPWLSGDYTEVLNEALRFDKRWKAEIWSIFLGNEPEKFYVEGWVSDDD